MDIARFVLKSKTSSVIAQALIEQYAGFYETRQQAANKLADLYQRLCDEFGPKERELCKDSHLRILMETAGVFVGIEEIRIPLTNTEIYSAWQRQDRIFKTEDCMAAVYAVAGYDPDEEEDSPDNQSAATSFMDRYGISVRDVAEGAGEEGEKIRAKMIARFEKIEDANLDCNFLWRDAVRQILNEIEERR